MVDLILDTTAQILLVEGYEQVTTNRIAQLAGISIGSLYQYFPNKGEILRAIALRLQQEGHKHARGSCWHAAGVSALLNGL